MLLLIIGLIIGIALFVIGYKMMKKEKEDEAREKSPLEIMSYKPKKDRTALIIISYVFGFWIIIIFLGLSGGTPSGGYNEWKKSEEYILTNLYQDSQEIKYVRHLGDDYTFRYKFKTEFGEDSKLVSVVSNISEEKYVEIVETNDGNPHLEKLERKGKGSIWTFEEKPTQTKYIFYIPKESIMEEANIEELN